MEAIGDMWDPKIIAWKEFLHIQVCRSQHVPSKFSQEQEATHTARKPGYSLCNGSSFWNCWSMSKLTAEVVLFYLHLWRIPPSLFVPVVPIIVLWWLLVDLWTQFTNGEVWRVLSISYLISSLVTLFMFIETLNKTLQGKLIVSLC